ncbi:B-cell receptor CD22-like [Cottoperca gobio]|uniref:B-cell receptor CD22-like n=1 Tax=Cottoperca gobio TaxID=56716 RepID=A0A6J2Q5X2_COTGO|nr:B-cell receptor CD22-like [Cottoperca gobio]
MSVERGNLTWTLMLLFLTGVLCGPWNVKYQREHICAVNGSSVVLLCSYDYPDIETVHSLKWGHERHNIYEGPFIFDSMINNSLRFQNIGDKRHNCSLKIQQVEHNDTGTYIFRFETKSEKGKWTGRGGSTLKVVDLNISVTKPRGNRTTKEGDSVNLTCINGCDGGNLSSAFTWFKNGEHINEGAVLYLSNMSSANSGNYTCSLKTHTGTTSGVTNIDVEYGPKNTSVSVRPSMEEDAGSNITLVCSSHANPPVENYTWFKIDEDDIMDVGHQPVFFPGDVEYWTTFSRDVLIFAAVAVLVLVAVPTGIAIRRRNKKRTKAPETDCEEDAQVALSLY